MTVNYNTLAAVAPLLLLLIGLSITVIIDPYIRREHRRVMLIIAALLVTLVAQNVLDFLVEQDSTQRMARTILGIYGYSVRPAVLVLFMYLFGTKRKTWPFWTLVGVNALIYSTALFSGISFSMDETNHFLRGPLGYSCHVVSGILLFCLLWITIRAFRRIKKAEMWLPLLNALLIIACVLMDSVFATDLRYPVTFLTVGIVISTVFYYIWLHLQFVRAHERDLMAAQRIRIMMTQIQPHFLFNALNTIRALYAKDPPMGDRILEDFSTYLRQNLESLNQTDLIPIKKELEHTQLYAEIEALRFPQIRVDYRIEDDAFSIPALTIQPLVENAIRHGVRSCKEGLVTVSTARETGGHRITIEDNGVGFDPMQEERGEKSHIGIQNVRERVEQMCGGTMVLRSEIGKGTEVTLFIPDAAAEKGKEREL
jgi:signal transduction histidine kinase